MVKHLVAPFMVKGGFKWVRKPIKGVVGSSAIARVRNGQKAGQTEKKRPSAPTVARCLTIFVMVKHLIEKTLIRCSTMFFVAV